MRCSQIHQFNQCLALQCENYAGHQERGEPCKVTHDGQAWYVSVGQWRLPQDEYGFPVKYKPIGCTGVQANSQ